MAAFNAYIYHNKQRKDGTWRLYVRFSHNYKTIYIPTEIFVGDDDITPSLRFRNNIIAEKFNDILVTYKKRLYELNLSLNEMSADDIVAHLVKKEKKVSMSFTAWAEEWIEEKSKVSKQSSNNYKTALRAYTSFLGVTEVMMADVNVTNMKRFERSLAGKARAQSLYCSAIAKMFNDARDQYNDEDAGVIEIKHSLRKYKAPKQNVAEKRALTVEQVRAIFALPYDNKVTRMGEPSLHDMALDLFKLSFCLMGMNSADMYNATEYDGETIVYQRTKTKGRRDDHAEMHVRVHPFVADIVEKYRGKKNVFSFCERYADLNSLNKYLNRGLKSIGAEIGVEGLQFYAARHSMATIAANDVGVDFWTINLMLCHTDPSMKVTQLYIRRDWSQENNAMFRVIDYVLGDSYSTTG